MIIIIVVVMVISFIMMSIIVTITNVIIMSTFLIGEWHLGNAMKTYDVIGDHRCNSYDVEKVPSYVTAMKGLREGTYVECCRNIDG